MIRFVDFGNQLSGGDGCEPDNWEAFGFWDTTANIFVCIRGAVHFTSLEDFEELVGSISVDDTATRVANRCRRLIPEKWRK